MNTKDTGPWLVFNIGCIECRVSSNIVGIYQTREEAKKVADICFDALSWRGGGQNEFEIFDLSKPQADEYRAAIAKATVETKCPHKHAALMAEYAEVAKTSKTPWTEFEWRGDSSYGNWLSLEEGDGFFHDHEYRRKEQSC